MQLRFAHHIGPTGASLLQVFISLHILRTQQAEIDTWLNPVKPQ